MSMAQNDNLMTAQQFNDKMQAWGDKVVSQAKAVVNAKTHSGAPKFKDAAKNKKLVDTLKASVKLGDDGIAKWIGFKFIKTGVWLPYGVGRGWVMQDGKLVQGSRVKKDSDIYRQLKKKGYSSKELKKYVVRRDAKSNVIPRSPVDWLDAVIENNMQEVADINGEFFGDSAVAKVLSQLDRITIKKNYTEIEIR